MSQLSVLLPPVPIPAPIAAPTPVSTPLPTPVTTPVPTSVSHPVSIPVQRAPTPVVISVPAIGPATVLETPLPRRRDTVASISLPGAFQKSCLKSKSYPSNYTLNSLSTYPTALKVRRNRLKENATDMFIPAGSAVDVPYRDLNAAGYKFMQPIFCITARTRELTS